MLDPDYQYFQYYGVRNSLNKGLHHNDDENVDNDSLPIVTISSYNDNDNFKSLINTKTNSFGMLSTNFLSMNDKSN